MEISLKFKKFMIPWIWKFLCGKKMYGNLLIDHGVIPNKPKDAHDALQPRASKSRYKRTCICIICMYRKSMVMLVNAHNIIISNNRQDQHTNVKIKINLHVIMKIIYDLLYISYDR